VVMTLREGSPLEQLEYGGKKVVEEWQERWCRRTELRPLVVEDGKAYLRWVLDAETAARMETLEDDLFQDGFLLYLLTFVQGDKIKDLPANPHPALIMEQAVNRWMESREQKLMSLDPRPEWYRPELLKDSWTGTRYNEAGERVTVTMLLRRVYHLLAWRVYQRGTNTFPADISMGVIKGSDLWACLEPAGDEAWVEQQIWNIMSWDGMIERVGENIRFQHEMLVNFLAGENLKEVFLRVIRLQEQ